MDKTRRERYCVSSGAIVKDAIKILNAEKGKIVIVLNTDVNPRTAKILNMFDPSIFPTAIFNSDFITEYILANSSGKLVPMATNVIDITLSLIPIFSAIFFDDFINKSVPM